MVKRPLSVTIIAWFFILIAPTIVFLDFLGPIFASESIMLAFGPWLWIAEKLGRSNTGFSDLMVTAPRIAGTTLCIAAGYAALKLRPWARVTLEFLSWLALIYWIANWAIWGRDALIAGLSAASVAAAIVGGAFVNAVPCGVCAWMIRTLRKPAIRQVFNK